MKLLFLCALVAAVAAKDNNSNTRHSGSLGGTFGNRPVPGGGFGNRPVPGGGFGTRPAVGGIGHVSPVAPPLIGGIEGVGGIGGVGNIGGGFGNCRNYCKDDYGQYQCCDDIKSGQCPPVRPACPPVRSGPPRTCVNDLNCGGVDKCCFDTCLNERVCKSPIGFGRR